MALWNLVSTKRMCKGSSKNRASTADQDTDGCKESCAADEACTAYMYFADRKFKKARCWLVRDEPCILTKKDYKYSVEAWTKQLVEGDFQLGAKNHICKPNKKKDIGMKVDTPEACRAACAESDVCTAYSFFGGLLVRKKNCWLKRAEACVMKKIPKKYIPTECWIHRARSATVEALLARRWPFAGFR